MFFRQKNSVIFDCLRHPSGKIKVSLLPRTGRHFYLNNIDEEKHVELEKACVYLSQMFFSVQLAMHLQISKVSDNKIIHYLILSYIYLYIFSLYYVK